MKGVGGGGGGRRVSIFYFRNEDIFTMPMVHCFSQPCWIFTLTDRNVKEGIASVFHPTCAVFEFPFVHCRKF